MTNRLREYRHAATGVIGTYSEQLAAIFPELELVEDVVDVEVEPAPTEAAKPARASKTTPPTEL